MSRWLLAAAAYNLVFGAVAVLAPSWMLTTLGAAPGEGVLAPRLWACIGMIVGVYGVGYAIAARDPARHWPIVFVGLLGKVLGPIGFVDAAMRGDLPWSMGAIILTNDLLWWGPFLGILWHAARSAQPAPPVGDVSLADALDELVDDRGVSLRTRTDTAPTLVVLVRHAGCTFCSETLADLARQEDGIVRQGTQIAVVGLGPSVDRLRALGERFGLRSATWYADPDRVLYRALELRRGTFLQLFGPAVWLRGMLATLRGHRVGRLEGDGLQMPGAFLLEGDRIVRAHRHRTVADRPEYGELACHVS